MKTKCYGIWLLYVIVFTTRKLKNNKNINEKYFSWFTNEIYDIKFSSLISYENGDGIKKIINNSIGFDDVLIY